jgi:hypothetical protein
VLAGRVDVVRHRLLTVAGKRETGGTIWKRVLIVLIDLGPSVDDAGVMKFPCITARWQAGARAETVRMR